MCAWLTCCRWCRADTVSATTPRHRRRASSSGGPRELARVAVLAPLRLYLALSVAVLAAVLALSLLSAPRFVDPVTNETVSVFPRALYALERHAAALEAAAARPRAHVPWVQWVLLTAASAASKVVRAAIVLRRYGPPLVAPMDGSDAEAVAPEDMVARARAAEAWLDETLAAALAALVDAYRQARDAAVEAALALAGDAVPLAYQPALAVGTMLAAALVAYGLVSWAGGGAAILDETDVSGDTQ